MTAMQAVGENGGPVKVGTFGTDAEVVKSIQSDGVQWAIDTQPFLQGYLAVDSLWLYLNNGNTIRWRRPGSDRTRVRRRKQCRRHRRVRGEGDSMTDSISVAVIGAGMAGRAHAAGYRTATTLSEPNAPMFAWWP